jgi:hypothetical protein
MLTSTRCGRKHGQNNRIAKKTGPAGSERWSRFVVLAPRQDSTMRQPGLPPLFLQSARNFLRSLPRNPLAVA